MKKIKSLLFAISFLTIFPININFSPKDIKNSIKFFPVIGSFIGLFLFIIILILKNVSLPIKCFLILFVWEFITGFFHLDGLADTSDAIFSARTNKEELFKIMKDSRIGTMGVSIIFFVLLGKFLFLKEILNQSLISVVIIPIIGRFAINFLSWKMDYAKEKGLGKFLCENNSNKDFLFALIFTLLFCIFIGKLKYLINFFFILLILYFFSKFFQKKFNGVTGDLLGFSVEIIELIFMFLISFN